MGEIRDLSSIWCNSLKRNMDMLLVSLTWLGRTKNFDKRPNRRQKIHWRRNSHWEKITLRTSWTPAAWYIARVGQQFVAPLDTFECTPVMNSFSRRPRYGISPNLPRRFGLKTVCVCDVLFAVNDVTWYCWQCWLFCLCVGSLCAVAWIALHVPFAAVWRL